MESGAHAHEAPSQLDLPSRRRRTRYASMTSRPGDARWRRAMGCLRLADTSPASTAYAVHCTSRVMRPVSSCPSTAVVMPVAAESSSTDSPNIPRRRRTFSANEGRSRLTLPSLAALPRPVWLYVEEGGRLSGHEEDRAKVLPWLRQCLTYFNSGVPAAGERWGTLIATLTHRANALLGRGPATGAGEVGAARGFPTSWPAVSPVVPPRAKQEVERYLCCGDVRCGFVEVSCPKCHDARWPAVVRRASRTVQ